MENKDKYCDLLRENNGQLTELDLGEQIGLDEEGTRKIIAQLLSEYKIEYMENSACNYTLIKSRKRKIG